MLTKYFIHGGYAGRDNAGNNKFFAEILREAPNNPRVLLVYLAKEAIEYSRMRREDTRLFLKNAEEKTPSFEIAEEQSLSEQIKVSDVIYLHGGSTPRLLKALRQLTDVESLFAGKIIAGESAGAYALSACFYIKSENGVFPGLGLVPINIICHYTGKDQEKLSECSEELETLLLPDYQYKVFEKRF